MSEHCNPYNIAGAGYDNHDFVTVDDKGNVTGPADECLRCGKPTPEKAECDAAYRHADTVCLGPWWPDTTASEGSEQ